MTDYIANHKAKINRTYNNLQNRLIGQKERIAAETNTEFKINQVEYKKKLFTRDKEHNKFIGLFTIIILLDRKRVEVKNNKNKLEVAHLKELRKSLLQAQYEEDNNLPANDHLRTGPSSRN